jgi:hypothetical protein
VSDHSASLTDLLRDAAIQRRFMRARALDREFEREGGRIIYAVDADVVSMYGDPAAIAVGRDGRIGYGQVFHDDEKSLSNAISARLADYVFFELSPHVPLMVIPPIEFEIATMIRVLAKDFGSTPPSITLDETQVRNCVGELRQNLSGDHAESSNYIRLAEKALKLIYMRTGKSEAFRRLNNLLYLDKITSPENVAEKLGDNNLIQTFASFSKISDMFNHSLLSREWTSRLKGTHNEAQRDEVSRKRSFSIERDAKALALLEIWNSKIEEFGYKIVYITGSRQIFEATQSYCSDNSLNFAEHYIRHPRTFLADAGVLRTDEDDLSADGLSPFANWLKIFLANADAGEDILDGFKLAPHAKEVAITAMRRNGGLAQKCRNGWRNYSDNLRAAYRPPIDVVALLTEEMRSIPNGNSVLREWNTIEADLDRKIEDSIGETWEICFRAATKTGWTFAFYGASNAGIPSRCPPPLRFDSWPETEKFICKISGWHRDADFDTHFYESKIGKINEEDSTGYAYYLAHAALFAGRGLWSVAGILSERAVSKIEGFGNDKNGYADGREGCFLTAFCRRHSARSLKDLDGLEDLLSKAEMILDRETQSRPALDAVRERFDTERLALGVTRHLFERFQKVSVGLSEGEAVDSLMKSADVILDKIDNRLASDVAISVKDMLLRTEFRVALNMASLFLHPAFDIESLAFDHRFNRIADIVCRARDACGMTGPFSFFAEGVRMCISAIRATGNERRAIAEEAANYFHPSQIQSYLVFPYDSARFSELRRIAIDISKKRPI